MQKLKYSKTTKRKQTNLQSHVAIPAYFLATGGASKDNMSSCFFRAPYWTVNFLSRCGIDWLSFKQALSAVSHKTAAGKSAWSKFHLLCDFLAAAQQLPGVSFLVNICCCILLRPCEMLVTWCLSKFEWLFVHFPGSRSIGTFDSLHIHVHTSRVEDQK